MAFAPSGYESVFGILLLYPVGIIVIASARRVTHWAPARGITFVGSGSLAGMVFQRPSLSHYSLTNIAKPARRYDVYVHAQQVLQIGHEPGQIEERPALVHVNQEIDVAVLPVVSAGHRTKNTNIAGAVQFGELEDVRLLLLGPQCFQGDHPAYLYCRLPRLRLPGAVAYNTSSDHPSSTCLALVMNWSASAPSTRRWSKLSERWQMERMAMASSITTGVLSTVPKPMIATWG